jgi:hypothetical protein
LHWSALRSTWTARWGPADDLPLTGNSLPKAYNAVFSAVLI